MSFFKKKLSLSLSCLTGSGNNYVVCVLMEISFYIIYSSDIVEDLAHIEYKNVKRYL